MNNRNTYKQDVPVRCWRARLISVIDDTGEHWKNRGDCDTIIGEMRLLPGWDTDTVEFDGWGELELSTFFRKGNDEKLARRVLGFEPGQLILVTGKLNYRNYKSAQGFDHLNTKFDLEDAEFDFTEGKHSPLVAHFYTSG